MKWKCELQAQFDFIDSLANFTPSHLSKFACYPYTFLCVILQSCQNVYGIKVVVDSGSRVQPFFFLVSASRIRWFCSATDMAFYAALAIPLRLYSNLLPIIQRIFFLSEIVLQAYRNVKYLYEMRNKTYKIRIIYIETWISEVLMILFVSVLIFFPHNFLPTFSIGQSMHEISRNYGKKMYYP